MTLPSLLGLSVGEWHACAELCCVRMLSTELGSGQEIDGMGESFDEVMVGGESGPDTRGWKGQSQRYGCGMGGVVATGTEGSAIGRDGMNPEVAINEVMDFEIVGCATEQAGVTVAGFADAANQMPVSGAQIIGVGSGFLVRNDFDVAHCSAVGFFDSALAFAFGTVASARHRLGVEEGSAHRV